MIGTFVSDKPGTRIRDAYCDGWGTQRTHAAPAREYRLRCAPVSEYPFDTEAVWLCNDCAVLLCAMYWLRGTTVRERRIWRDNFYVRTEQRTFGVWERVDNADN